ncbi:hypothetical protein [Streptomyces sp. NPDC014006]
MARLPGRPTSAITAVRIAALGAGHAGEVLEIHRLGITRAITSTA